MLHVPPSFWGAPPWGWNYLMPPITSIAHDLQQSRYCLSTFSLMLTGAVTGAVCGVVRKAESANSHHWAHGRLACSAALDPASPAGKIWTSPLQGWYTSYNSKNMVLDAPMNGSGMRGHCQLKQQRDCQIYPKDAGISQAGPRVAVVQKVLQADQSKGHSHGPLRPQTNMFPVWILVTIIESLPIVIGWQHVRVFVSGGTARRMVIPDLI